ncbi:hypothetical protein EK904_010601, partial [Melospiza melodia maxima]
MAVQPEESRSCCWAVLELLSGSRVQRGQEEGVQKHSEEITGIPAWRDKGMPFSHPSAASAGAADRSCSNVQREYVIPLSCLFLAVCDCAGNEGGIPVLTTDPRPGLRAPLKQPNGYKPSPLGLLTHPIDVLQCQLQVEAEKQRDGSWTPDRLHHSPFHPHQISPHGKTTPESRTRMKYPGKEETEPVKHKVQTRKINQLLQEKTSKRNSSREGAGLLLEVKIWMGVVQSIYDTALKAEKQPVAMTSAMVTSQEEVGKKIRVPREREKIDPDFHETRTLSCKQKGLALSQLKQRYLCQELLLAEVVDPASVSFSGVQWLSSHLATNDLKQNYTKPLGEVDDCSGGSNKWQKQKNSKEQESTAEVKKQLAEAGAATAAELGPGTTTDASQQAWACQSSNPQSFTYP